MMPSEAKADKKAAAIVAGTEKLLQACQAQDMAAVKKLIKPEFLMSVVHGTSPLHTACTNGSDEMCQLLLRKGAPIDMRDGQNYTPLLCAASQRHFTIVKALLDLGADPTLVNDGGTGVIHYLIRTAADQEMTQEQRSMLEYCITSGSNVNCSNKFGETPLHQATMRRQLDMAIFLLEHGAAINQTNKFGESALHKAVLLKHVGLVKLLLARGADPNIQSCNGKPRDLLDGADPVSEDAIRELLVHAEATFHDDSALPMDNTRVVRRFFDGFQRALDSHGDVTDPLLLLTDRGSAGSSSLGGANGASVSAPKISVRAAVEIGTKAGSETMLDAHVVDRGSISLPHTPKTVKAERRKSIDLLDVADDDVGQARKDPSPTSKSGNVSPRGGHKPFGAVGSGITRRRAGSMAELNVKVTRASPVVARLVRQPSTTDVQPTFTPDPSYRQEESGFGRFDDLVITKVNETYREEFSGKDHSVFLCSEGVVTILHDQTRNSHLVLVLDASGYRRMTLPAPQLVGKDFVAGCLNWISLNVFSGTDVYRVEDDKEIKEELVRVEAMAAENSPCFRIGVVYVKEGDSTEDAMFKNSMDAVFEDFLRLIGDEIDLLGWGGFRGQLSVTQPGRSFYTSFRGCEVMFHVAPLMTPEEHRRLIGNDTAVLYFHDSDKEPFPSAAPRSAMTQVYGVVKRLDEGRKLKVGFMSRKQVAEYGPSMPLNPTFDVLTAAGRAVFKDFLLCRLLNGYRSATVSPPLNKMLRRPRSVVISKLIEKYPIDSVKRKSTLRFKK